MPGGSVVLTTDAQLWDVLDPFLEKLENTVAQRFPEESIAQTRCDQEEANLVAVDKRLANANQIKENLVKLAELERENTTLATQLEALQNQQLQVNQGGIDEIRLSIGLGTKKIDALQRETMGLLTETGDPNLIWDGTTPIALMQQSAAVAERVDKHLVRLANERVQIDALIVTRKGEVASLEKKYRTARENLARSIAEVKAVRNTDGATYTDLSPTLTKLAKVTPGIYGDTVRDFNLACDSADHLKKVVEVRDQLQEKYTKALKTSGDKHTVTMEVELGAGLSAFALDLRATVIVGVTVEVEKLGNGRLKATRKGVTTLNVRGRGGAEVSDEVVAKIRAGVKGNLGLGKSQEYANIDDFVTEQSNTYLASVMAGSGNKKNRQFIDETDQLLIETNRSLSRLEKNLTHFGALENKKLKLTKKDHVDKVISWTASASVDASASVAFKSNTLSSGLGGSLGASAAATATTSYKQVSYLDDLSATPVLQKIHMLKQPKGMGFFAVGDDNNLKYLSGVEAINSLDQIELDVAFLKTLQSDRDAKDNFESIKRNLLQNISLLKQEYNDYVDISDYVDKVNQNGDVSARLKELNARRGAKDSADYVKSMTLQFARLNAVYESCFDSPDDIPAEARDITTNFREDLRVPRVKMSDAQLERAFGYDAKTKATVVTANSGYITADLKYMGDESVNNTRAGVSFKVGVKHEIKDVPGAPIEETRQLSFSLNTGAKGSNYIASLFSLGHITEKFGDDAVAIKEELKTIFSNAVDGSVEINFVKKHGHWVLKNAKGFRAKDRNIRAKLAVGGTVQAIAGLTYKKSDKQVRNIYFGTKTLAALTDVYRAKHFNDQSDDSSWNEFRESQGLLLKMVKQYKSELAAVNAVSDLEAKKKIRTPISNDIDEWLTIMKDSPDVDDRALADSFVAAVNDGQGDDAEIEEALSTLVKRKVVSDARAVSEGFIKRRSVKVHDINDYAATVISDHMDSFVADYVSDFENSDFESSEVSDVEDLLKKVKAIYKKKSNDRHFEMLKKAYAIDYATQHLNDLTETGGDDAKNKAVALLGGDIETILNGDHVYLNDRVDGKLVRAADGGLEVQPIIRKGLSKVINQNEISSALTQKMTEITVKELPVQMRNGDGAAVSWTASLYSKDQKSKYNTSRSTAKRKFNYWSSRFKFTSRTSIAESISKVMEQRNKKRREQQRAAVTNRQRTVSR